MVDILQLLLLVGVEGRCRLRVLKLGRNRSPRGLLLSVRRAAALGCRSGVGRPGSLTIRRRRRPRRRQKDPGQKCGHNQQRKSGVGSRESRKAELPTPYSRLPTPCLRSTRPHGFVRISWGCAVKCPNCGSVSFPGVQQCKKCGHRFAPAALDEAEPGRVHPSGASPVEEPLTPAPPAASPGFPGIDELRPARIKSAAELLDSVPIEPKISRLESAPTRDPTPDLRPDQTWRSELTARVTDFRRRRARARRKPDPNS